MGAEGNFSHPTHVGPFGTNPHLAAASFQQATGFRVHFYLYFGQHKVGYCIDGSLSGVADPGMKRP